MALIKNDGSIKDRALCRCCRTIKKCRLLTSEYTWMEKKEIYADMITTCFGILLSHVDEEVKDSGVCETCVVRLRDACAFRQQVLQCEELFLSAKLEDKDGSSVEKKVGIKTPLVGEKNTYDRDKDRMSKETLLAIITKLENKDETNKDRAIELKTEPTDDCSGHNSLAEDHQELISLDSPPAIVETNTDTEMELKTEPTDDCSGHNSLAEDHQELISLDYPTAIVETNTDTEMELKTEPTDDCSGHNSLAEDHQELISLDYPTAIAVAPPRDLPTSSKWSMTQAEKINAAYILANTTVTPFTYFSFPSSYKCLYCEEKYIEIHILLEHSRNHVVPSHDKILKDILNKGKKRNIKVDISNLKCRLCDQPFSSLEEIQTHLGTIHSISFIVDAGNGMIAFNLKMNNDLFTCHICTKTFQSFFLLNKHISVHYSIAVCDSCGKRFLSHQSLIKHMESHRNVTYPCEKCKKVFPSTSKLKYHNDKFHGTLGRAKLAKCQKCLARFEHHYEKVKHLKEVHGVSFTFTCDTCNLVFKTQPSLNLHVVKNHTQRYACDICRKTFSVRYHLRRHMASHSHK